MKAMVLGAGVGSRLDPLTLKMPKPLVPVVNRPVIDHIFRLLAKHGISEVVCNLHYKAQSIERYFTQNPPAGINFKFLKEASLSGDAGGVRACRKYLENDTFLVIMGDLLTDADLTSIVNLHKRKGALASIAVTPVEDVTKFGVVVRNSSGFIEGFQEKPSLEEALAHEISTGIYVLEPSIFEHIPQTGTYGFGRELFPSLITKGLPVLGVDINSYWSDVGTFETYLRSNIAALNGTVQIEITDPLKDEVYYGDGCSLDPDCTIKGKGFIGAHSVLENAVRLNGNVIIGPKSRIGAKSVLENCLVIGGSTVPPGSDLRNCIWCQDKSIYASQPEALVQEH